MILTELVTENYDKLNKNDLKIYSYIMINKARFIEKNINELGDLLDLSPSSIVGFSKKLGLDGFCVFYLVFIKFRFIRSRPFDHISKLTKTI